MSLVLKLSGNTSLVRARYFPPIILDSDYEVALISIDTWNFKANVTLNNNKFYYKLNDVPLKGDDKLRLVEETVVLIGNHSTFKTELLFRYTVDFSQPENIGSI